jgi:hypothetical protein
VGAAKLSTLSQAWEKVVAEGFVTSKRNQPVECRQFLLGVDAQLVH